MPTWFMILSLVSILAFALVGGVFLAFSDFIMRSLARSGPKSGVLVMQSINREVFRWVFMALFLGMAAVSTLIAAYALFALEGPGATLLALGALVYVVGVFGVTVARNVPLNNRLAALDADSADAVAFWAERYLPDWTFWNTVRTVGSVLAAGLALAGLLGSAPL